MQLVPPLGVPAPLFQRATKPRALSTTGKNLKILHFVYKIEGVDGALFTFPAWKQHKCPTNGLMRSSLSPRRRSQADAWQSQADGCLATPGRPARGHTHTHRERIGQEESVTVFFHHFWRTDRISTLQETLEPLAGPPCQFSPPYHP